MTFSEKKRWNMGSIKLILGLVMLLCEPEVLKIMAKYGCAHLVYG